MKYIKYSLIVIGVVIGFGFYFINQPKKSIAGKKADYTITPENLLKEFETDEPAANKKYLDKIISVDGKISSISSNDTGLITVFIETGNPMNNISCQLSKDVSEKGVNFQKNDAVKIKGICTGMLMDVVLVDCVIITDDKNE